MKLIIDVDESLLNEAKNGHICLSEFVDVVMNGIPYEEKPQGEWEDYSVDFYKCPECGYLLNKDCPYCQNKIILPKGGAE